VTNTDIDLDDLFNDLFYVDLPGNENLAAPAPVPSAPTAAAAVVAAPKRPAKSTPLPLVASASLSKRDADTAALDEDEDEGELTEQQKLERRERNREHAKRSRLRKKFLLESLQEQIHGLEEQISGLKEALQRELPEEKAQEIIASVCGDKEKYTPLPMPSGFGPVKTLMEPDFRLMSALSGSQQNFAISDPTLPDNPIVYVSQGFLDLTGYPLNQVLGRNCRFLQGPGTDQSAVEVIRKGILEGVDTSVCLLNYRADGTPFWNQFFVAALRDAENNIVNYVGVQCEVSKAVVDKHMGQKQQS
jgi:PAS domain S-box-containing protein